MKFNSLNGSLPSTPGSYYSAYSPIVSTPSSARFYTPPSSEEFDSTGSSTDSNQSSPQENKAHDEELYEKESTIEDVTEHVVRPSVLKQLERTHSSQTYTSTAGLLKISAAIGSPSRDLKDGTSYCNKTNNKRLKLKTVGKLLLPATFMSYNNDRNNNSQNYNNKNNCQDQELKIINNEEIKKSDTQKPTIGKIKSIFIDVCQQQAKLKQTETEMEVNCQDAINEIVLRRKPLDRISTTTRNLTNKFRAASYHGMSTNTTFLEETPKSLASDEYLPITQKYAKIFNNKMEDIENTPANNNTPVNITKHPSPDNNNRNLINAHALVQERCNTPQKTTQSKYAKYFGLKKEQQQHEKNKGRQRIQNLVTNKRPQIKAAVFDQLIMLENGINYARDLQVTAKDLAVADKNFNDLLIAFHITEKDIAESDKKFEKLYADF